ncbi:hypothetical protein K439DRAFT_1327826 [Ramaria rubella]|nr:hypothetical protein K439DRAFT_1327826 [Ramaria rubella]
MPASSRTTSSPAPAGGNPTKNTSQKDKLAAKEPKKKWTAAEEAAIITTLLGQKAAGNMSDSGFKPSVWKIVMEDLVDISPIGMNKNMSQCKLRYQQLKGEYKIVKVLQELSGFGWDEGTQCVTAPLEVWEKYLAVSSTLLTKLCWLICLITVLL